MDALSRASDHTVRAILMALCADSRIYDKALSYLNQLEPEAVTKAKDTKTSPSDAKKRKPSSGLSICVQCDAPFSEDTTELCRYHPGDMDPDEEGGFWDEHEEHWGPIDTEENRRDMPEGFLWTCCDKVGTEPGCTSAPHQSNPDLSGKSGRYQSEP
ncbi:hypothetical protein C8A05DRAFT_39350 [Staphylotrichum tortipilum]|uniref:Uncharacterized protein n=1 Tax=Staphylotrichum tortipilum TaxID=2831512 RepID=A0AAN6MBM9_9PEZI|nr:hypothetical protein C8A05DRAFT_39350 [Staphylotrichum longicolle]